MSLRRWIFDRLLVALTPPTPAPAPAPWVPAPHAPTRWDDPGGPLPPAPPPGPPPPPYAPVLSERSWTTKQTGRGRNYVAVSAPVEKPAMLVLCKATAGDQRATFKTEPVVPQFMERGTTVGCVVELPAVSSDFEVAFFWEPLEGQALADERLERARLMGVEPVVDEPVVALVVDRDTKPENVQQDGNTADAALLTVALRGLLDKQPRCEVLGCVQPATGLADSLDGHPGAGDFLCDEHGVGRSLNPFPAAAAIRLALAALKATT